jgi:Ca2+-binding EF-hand superfamily protein
LFDKSGVRGREDDRILLASRLVTDLGTHGTVLLQRFLSFCEEEIDREDWTLCSRRLRLAADSAYAAGEDVQQRLCEYDMTGSHSVSSARFRDFLVYLSKFGKVQEEDRALCVRHFSRLSSADKSTQTSLQDVSLKDVMSFLGRDYVGNLQLRIQRCISNNKISGAKDILSLFMRHKQASSGGAQVRSLSHREAESALGELGVFAEVTHDQLLLVLKTLDTKGSGFLSIKQLMAYLGVDYSARDISGGEVIASTSALSPREPPVLNIEDMLRILLEKVRNNGLAVDEAFRHFDTDGDGSISVSELEQALDDLCIFSSISNWKEQVPSLLAKFDSSGDGHVSLREFFKFLGLSADYAPNIVQKMTNIFAIATQKGLTIKDIFAELDADGSGALNADELQAGLKKIGTFGEISSEDAVAVVKRFDKDGDEKVSTEEFVKFFAERIHRTVKDRGRKRADRKPIVRQFREVMAAVQAKGLSARELFSHIDKDKGGSISVEEFSQVLTRLPQFKDLPQSGLHEIFNLIDGDGSGGVTLSEFEQFLSESNNPNKSNKIPSPALSDRVRDVFKTASAKGLSFAKCFELVDRDGDGQMTGTELGKALKRLPHFVNVENQEVESLFRLIDTDSSGVITIAEFKHFVEGGEPVRDRRKPPRSDQQAVRESEALSDGEFSALFVRHMNSLLRRDSGVFARLDKDEDGLVETSVLLKVLSKNGAFDTLSATRCEDLLHQFIVQRQFVSLEAFMSFVGDRPSVGKLMTQKERSRVMFQEEATDEKDALKRDYDFSANPETKALEKKVRGFGQILAKKGVDVEAMFRDFDTKLLGMVRRSELVEVLSRLGMHILEQGRIFDHALFPGDDLRRDQVRQINRLKGSGGDYIKNAPRLARRALLADGSNTSHGVEFTVYYFNVIQTIYPEFTLLGPPRVYEFGEFVPQQSETDVATTNLGS